MQAKTLRGSKISFAFAKAPRFAKPSYECPLAYYQGLGKREGKKVNIGTSKKWDI